MENLTAAQHSFVILFFFFLHGMPDVLSGQQSLGTACAIFASLPMSALPRA